MVFKTLNQGPITQIVKTRHLINIEKIELKKGSLDFVLNLSTREHTVVTVVPSINTIAPLYVNVMWQQTSFDNASKINRFQMPIN